MPRENSFTDSVGRSLTPDLDEAPATSPPPTQPIQHPHFESNGHEHHIDIASLTSGRSKRSLRSRFLPQTSPTTVIFDQHPKERFRKLVHRVISLHRGATLLNTTTVGAEPGIDPSRPSVDAVYRHIIEDCEIEVIDYSAVRSNSRRLNNKEFIELMHADPKEREPWVKVRWINIGGISWDVIKAMSIKYGLHPLALEDVILAQSQNRSKVEYYTQHLFLNVACHELADRARASPSGTNEYADAPRSSSPVPMSDFGPTKQEKSEADDAWNLKSGGIGKLKSFGQHSLLPLTRVDVKPVHEEKSTLASRQLSMLSNLQAQQNEHKKDVAAVAALKNGSRLNVEVSSMFFFLLRDGTVISLRPTPDLSFTAPISYRLKSRDTVIRKSADASLLLYALIDLIVDKAIQVIDQYNIKIQKFERDILLNIQMSTVRELHILSGDLVLHKHTLDPVKTLLYGLRRYDDDRAAALVDATEPGNKDVKVRGFMSAKSKIYLAGAHDHMEYVLTSLDMFASVAENLIAYSFNTKSYEMNNVMRRLTVTTIIFLPLSFLAGYFGMNFHPFWAVNNHNDLFFWKVCLPILVAVVPAALWMDLKELWSSISKKREIKHAVR